MSVGRQWVGVSLMFGVLSTAHAANETILFYGDSITAGGHWVKSVADHMGVNAINAGRSGRRAAWASKELVPYLKEHPRPDPTVMSPRQERRPVKGWPEAVKTVNYPASIDDSQQPMLMYEAEGNRKRPLLVGLHTWSAGYTQAVGEVVYARWCMENNWHFIHPHFRGPNKTPDACGSDKVVQDIIDAVAYAKKTCNVDTNRIYLVGASGGGYAALMMAARAPELWAGVSAWVPISDIYAWWKQKATDGPAHYAKHIESAVGGIPDQNEQAMQECIKRSPLTYLQNARAVNLDINAGVYDGHKGGSVPFTHSLLAFNKVVPENQRIDDTLIGEFYRNQSPPPTLPEAAPDALYGTKPVIFRKTHQNTRVTIFKGGHEIIHSAALNWLAAQHKNQHAIWHIEKPRTIKTADSDGESGK